VKCSHCHLELNLRNVWIIALYAPEPHVLNLHARCLMEITGRSAWDKLSREAVRSGWTQLALPMG